MFRAWWGLGQVPAGFGPCALTIGNFDGIHAGHRKILATTRESARALGCQAGVLIFDPHPMSVVAPERAPALLTEPAERLRRFEEEGMDFGVVAKFTPQTAALRAEDFVSQVLVDRLHVRAVVVGEGFRFGHRQGGDFALLGKLGAQYNFEARAVPAVVVGGDPVSSTRVRDAIRSGRVDEARRLLERPFSLHGPVVAGHGVGSSQTVPTLNLAPQAQLLPANGVYITETRDRASSRCWPSVSNIGCRPTFDGRALSVETHLLTPLDDASLSEIEICFHQRLRDEKRFATPAKLREQILADVGEAKRFFRRLEASGG